MKLRVAIAGCQGMNNLIFLIAALCQPTDCLIRTDADGINIFTHADAIEREYVIDGASVYVWRYENDRFNEMVRGKL